MHAGSGTGAKFTNTPVAPLERKNVPPRVLRPVTLNVGCVEPIETAGMHYYAQNHELIARRTVRVIARRNLVHDIALVALAA
jgi:hypothetical protein